MELSKIGEIGIEWDGDFGCAYTVFTPSYTKCIKELGLEDEVNDITNKIHDLVLKITTGETNAV